jgi:hypothetical protein
VRVSSRAWYFKSAAQQLGHRVTFTWRWEATLPDGALEQSAHRFGTLAACVRDAQQSGFTGEVDPAIGAFRSDSYEIAVFEDSRSVSVAPRPR